MKGSKVFEERIKSYLDQRAAEDPQFAERYGNEKKSLEECCKYILGEVSASGQIGTRVTLCFANQYLFHWGGRERCV